MGLTVIAAVGWYVGPSPALAHGAVPPAPGWPGTLLAWTIDPLPLLAVAGMLFVVSQSSPAPELTGQIVRYTGIVLGQALGVTLIATGVSAAADAAFIVPGAAFMSRQQR